MVEGQRRGQGRRLRLAIRRGVSGALAGAYTGARPGTGLTFAELRPYEPGDEVRWIDWNATARLGRPYVRRHVEERALTLQLVVDLSPSMRFGEPTRTKVERACEAALLLASAALGRGDRVGLTTVGGGPAPSIPPAGGGRQLERLAWSLELALGTEGSPSALLVQPSDLMTRGRGLVMILADFLKADSKSAVGWKELARRHDLMALRFVEPREETLPDAGLVRFVEAETGRVLTADTSSRRVRTAYAEAAVRRRAAFRAWCTAASAEGYTLSTDRDPFGELVRIFEIRIRRRNRGRPGS